MPKPDTNLRIVFTREQAESTICELEQLLEGHDERDYPDITTTLGALYHVKHWDEFTCES